MPVLQRILQEFEKQSMMMGVKEDLLTDSIDETVCEAEEEKERWRRIVRVFLSQSSSTRISFLFQR